MWVSSRQYCSPRVSEGTSDEVTFGQHPNTVPFPQHYSACPDELEAISLYEFYQWFDVKGDQYKRHSSCGAKLYIVDVWPLFVGDPADAENYEEFCHAKVFLHHPHHAFNNLLTVDISDWTTFYQHC